MTAHFQQPMRNAWRDALAPECGGQAEAAAPGCPICSSPLPSARARFCSAACRQRAFRLRHTDRLLPDDGRLRETLRRKRTLIAHTVYVCPNCDERFVGLRRCPECQLFCRAVGLGGPCPECDQIILVADLLGEEVLL